MGNHSHMTDDVSEVLIVTSVCLSAREALSKKVTVLDRLRVRTNVILFLYTLTVILTLTLELNIASREYSQNSDRLNQQHQTTTLTLITTLTVTLTETVLGLLPFWFVGIMTGPLNTRFQVAVSLSSMSMEITRCSAIAGRPCDAKACQGLLTWTWK